MCYNVPHLAIKSVQCWGICSLQYFRPFARTMTIGIVEIVLSTHLLNFKLDDWSRGCNFIPYILRIQKIVTTRTSILVQRIGPLATLDALDFLHCVKLCSEWFMEVSWSDVICDLWHLWMHPLYRHIPVMEGRSGELVSDAVNKAMNHDILNCL